MALQHARIPVKVGNIQVAVGQADNTSHEALVSTSFFNDRPVSGSQIEGLPGPCHLQSKVLS